MVETISSWFRSFSYIFPTCFFELVHCPSYQILHIISGAWSVVVVIPCKEVSYGKKYHTYLGSTGVNGRLGSFKEARASFLILEIIDF